MLSSPEISGNLATSLKLAMKPQMRSRRILLLNCMLAELCSTR
jgi:hypothetical protein